MISRALLLGLSALTFAAADDLAPEILLLSRIKRHVKAEVGRLPDYTCLQTTARYRRTAGAKPSNAPVDTLVLEVLNAGPKELYASPGSRGFHEEEPGAFVGGGMSGTGMFGLFLRTLFVNDTGMFQYRGEEDFRGRRAVRYGYRVPAVLSGYTIQVDFARGKAAMKGSFLADRETLDLLWLEVEADDIPANLQLKSSVQNIEYALTRIGERDVMLPQTASMLMIDIAGGENRNVVEFTHCQSFRVESTLSFTPAEAGPNTVSTPPEERKALAPGIVLWIELADPVTKATTVGALIEGRVVADVRERGKVAIPAGSAVRGRVRRLERLEGYWAIGLEFTEIETTAGAVRFYANLQELDKQGGAAFLVRGPKKEELFLPYLPGVVQFFLPAGDLNLPKGFKTFWKTTSPRSANR
jgi:hypothetical protein